MAHDARARPRRSASRSRPRPHVASQSRGSRLDGHLAASDGSSSDRSAGGGRAALPAAQHRAELLRALERHAAVVCVGETGSGKTTQLPQYLLRAFQQQDEQQDEQEASRRSPLMIAVTQPRRVAAISVAHRVAEELGESRVGHGLVGYAVRFDDRSGPRTRVKFVTDGVLVRECLADPRLRRYRAVMLDEAHERSIHTDVLLGLLRRLVRSGQRPDLRVLVTSATLDADRFATFFAASDGEQCPVVRIPGRVFPVDIFHSKQRQIMGLNGPLAATTAAYARAAVETAMQVHNSEPAGHVLVFLTGQQEVETACAELRRLDREQQEEGMCEGRMKMRVLPLYGALSANRQREIFTTVPADTRKVIVATNIAETSLTIDGVRFVIDCGFVKQKVYDPERRMESLVVVPVSKVAAQQRAGRAGRTAPGKCFRLYDRESYGRMMQETVPEIQRTNLANTVLYLKLLGIRDVLGFDYLDPPDEDALLDALEQLVLLGAIDRDSGEPTAVGKLMSAFPLEPKASRALVEALARERCGQEMAGIVAMLSTENVFVEPSRHRRSRTERRGGGSDSEEKEHGGGGWEQQLLVLRRDGLLDESGDHLTLLNILLAFDRVSREHGQRRSRHGHDEVERWCEQRQLRPRALRMALAIRDQLDDIAASISSQDLDQVALSSRYEDRKTKREPSLSERLRSSRMSTYVDSVVMCLTA